jgi:hypothetical protein
MRTTAAGVTPSRTTRASYHPGLAKQEQDVFRSVNAALRGHNVERVYAALVARFREQFPGAELDEDNLQKVAAAISRGAFGHGRLRHAGPAPQPT